MTFKIVFIFCLVKLFRGEIFMAHIYESSILNEVDEKFLSVCLDQSIISSQADQHFRFNSTKMRTLLKELSPGYLRFGGSSSNWQYFDVPFLKLNHTDLNKFVILKKKFLSKLLDLVAETKHRLLLDINVELRLGNQWDPLNTISLLTFISNSGYAHLVDFELGNEPVYMDLKISKNQLAHDYVSFKMLLEQYLEFKNSSIMGPAIVDPNEGVTYMIDVINAMQGTLKAATFHHYYFRGDIASYKEYIDVNNFENLFNEINWIKKSVKETKYPLTSIYIGETSDAWHEGTPNVSDRFVSGFLWLEKLGLGALLGVKVIMRQTFFGFSYSLIDENLDPNPDYWLTWIHHLLVGKKVIGIKTDVPKTCRIYSHCTKKSKYYQSGAITVFVLNVNATEACEIIFNEPYAAQSKHLYLLEPYVDAPIDIPILSKKVMVNHKLLEMLDDWTMPDIRPNILQPKINPIIPPLTMAFIVFPKANSCF